MQLRRANISRFHGVWSLSNVLECFRRRSVASIQAVRKSQCWEEGVEGKGGEEVQIMRYKESESSMKASQGPIVIVCQ